jgi:HTH-type transcriptional regulator/antitoxin HigA
MAELNSTFAPDWVSPPGETINDIIEERNWTQAEFAQRMGYTEKHVSQLINGKVPLSDEAALRLERVLGSNVGFWLAREAKYREHCARMEAAKLQATWTPWLDELPIKDLMAFGAIARRRLTAVEKPAMVDSCLRFFGVASPEEWRLLYHNMQVSFRRSRAEQSDVGSIAAWLRLGERQVEMTEGKKYDTTRFENALRTIRSLTTAPPAVFEPRMRVLLQDAGVAFVMVAAIPRARVSGVARWLNHTRPLIQLSLYGRSNDKFWFTFFHEAAHILLHANTKEERKSVFLDDPNSDHAMNPAEREANEWAGDFLIPRKHTAELRGLRTKAAVRRFAEQIGVHPGIVVGRLQHDGLIEPSWMNDLKERFDIQTTRFKAS